jgi:hypothetical protein
VPGGGQGGPNLAQQLLVGAADEDRQAIELRTSADFAGDIPAPNAVATDAEVDHEDLRSGGADQFQRVIAIEVDQRDVVSVTLKDVVDEVEEL